MLDWSKLKAFADDKMNRIKKSRLVSGRVENIVGKGENAGYQHFLLFPQCFQKPSHLGSLKVGIVWERVKPRSHVTVLYAEHAKEPGGALSSFVLYPCTTPSNN